MRKIVLMVFLFLSIFVKAQELNNCGTNDRTDEDMDSLAWRKNYVEFYETAKLLKGIKRNSIRPEISDAKYNVPIRIVLHGTSGHNMHGMDDTLFQRHMDELNQFYYENNTDIQFYRDCETTQLIFKVEELTLYTIKQQKLIEEMQKQINELKNR